MIELTQLEAFGYISTILSAGIGIGYKLGERKTVTTMGTTCSVWRENHKGNITVLMMNTKRVNNNCPEFSQSKNICKLNNQKCKLID